MDTSGSEHVADVPVREFHEPYLAHNARICELLEAGEREAAAEAVAGYLREAEEHLLRDYPA